MKRKKNFFFVKKSEHFAERNRIFLCLDLKYIYIVNYLIKKKSSYSSFHAFSSQNEEKFQQNKKK